MSLLVAPLMVLWPAAALAALADGRRRPVGWAAAGVLAAAVGLLAALAVRVAADGPVEVVAGGWPADVGIRLRADALGAPAGPGLGRRGAGRAGPRGGLAAVDRGCSRP